MLLSWNSLKILTPLALGFCSTFASTGLVAADEVNAVALSNGAVLKSYTSEYGGRHSSKWIALALIDGDPNNGWSSAKNQSAPNEFVFELAQEFSLTSFAFDITHAEESQYPGISARSVTVSVSSLGANTGYQDVYVGELELSEENKISLAQPVHGRWIKLVVNGNGGYAEYTELMEFAAFGTPQNVRQETGKYSGVYDTNWGRFYLNYDNGELSGCYDHDNGYFSGKSVGGLMNIEWHEDNNDNGTAALAITADGSQFSGLWYESAQLMGTWVGKFSADQSSRPACAPKIQQETKSQVSYSMDTYGRAKLYGIYFDFDSDVIKPESAKTLGEIQAWLIANPGQSVVFEGHTDSKGSDEYNRTLSGKRATAVKNWLASRGIPKSRLTSLGLGEAQPVAANTTENGRSLNRRVEMRVLN